MSDYLAQVEARVKPTREDVAEALAREIAQGADLGLSYGEGMLHLALTTPIRETIEDVYADCGDSHPGVLSSNISRRLAYILPDAVLALWPGKTEAEVRKQLAEEHGIGDATSRPLYDAQVEIGRLQGLVRHLRTRERELEDQIARGGEQND